MQTSRINELRIEAYHEVARLEDELAEVKLELKRERSKHKRYMNSNKEIRSQLRNAINELSKKRPDILSDEEWRMVLESRGICA